MPSWLILVIIGVTELGHGGAIIANTVKNARQWMQDYEKNPMNFGHS